MKDRGPCEDCTDLQCKCEEAGSVTTAKDLIGGQIKTSNGNATVLNVIYTGLTTDSDMTITKEVDCTVSIDGKEMTFSTTEPTLLAVAV